MILPHPLSMPPPSIPHSTITTSPSTVTVTGHQINSNAVHGHITNYPPHSLPSSMSIHSNTNANGASMITSNSKPATTSSTSSSLTSTTVASFLNPGTWEEVRKNAKQIEFELDAKLASYSRLNSMMTTHQPSPSYYYRQQQQQTSQEDQTHLGSSSSLSSFSPLTKNQKLQLSESLSNEIQTALNQLLETIHKMKSLVQSDPSNISLSQHLQRHQDLLNDYTKEYNRTKNALTILNARHSSENSSMMVDDSLRDQYNGSVTDYLLSEKSKINSSHAGADQVIDIAYSAREGLYGQRSTLQGASNKLGILSNALPNIQGLIKRIALRRRRDTFIIGCVILFCLVMIFFYIRS